MYLPVPAAAVETDVPARPVNSHADALAPLLCCALAARALVPLAEIGRRACMHAAAQDDSHSRTRELSHAATHGTKRHHTRQ